MNQKAFDKELAKSIKNGILTYYTIKDFFDNNSKKNFFRHIDMCDLIMKRYEEIIENRSSGQMAAIITELYKQEKMREFIKSKMLYNIVQTKYFEFQYVLALELDDFDMYKFIEENVEYLFEKMDFRNVIKLFENKELFSNEFNQKLNQKLEKDKKIFLEKVLTKKLMEDNCISKQELSKILDILVKILDEVLENEEKKMIDISILSSGVYSNCILVGDKVIKVSKKRKTYKIPYDERILLPIIRFDLNTISNISGVIEVTEKVETREFNEETLYSLYKEMRKRNIKFVDIKSSNVGILLKDNIRHWKKNISPDLRNLGFEMHGKKINTLKKGEMVILDSDYIYNADEERIQWVSYLAEKFEDRYLQEKRAVKSVKEEQFNTVDENELYGKVR